MLEESSKGTEKTPFWRLERDYKGWTFIKGIMEKNKDAEGIKKVNLFLENIEKKVANKEFYYEGDPLVLEAKERLDKQAKEINEEVKKIIKNGV